MLLAVEPKDKEIVRTGPFLQQTSFWGRVKELQGCEVAAFEVMIDDDHGQNETASSGCKTDSDILVVVRPVGADKLMAHIPYGPKFAPDEELQGHFLEQLSEAMRPYLPRQCFCIRYDLPWKSCWADDNSCYDSKGEWLGPPREEIQEIRMNIGTDSKKLRKSPTNILPVNTIYLELRKEEKALLDRMRSKTRYNIRLSQRKGVRVFEAGLAELDLWYRLYQETARRNNFVVHDRYYFESILKAGHMLNDRNISMHLLMAELNGDFLAGMFLAISGEQAVYLYGASSREKNNAMPTYGLQWEAIRRARQVGCRYYDMFGAAPSAQSTHPMNGLYRFKKGFGGKIYHRQGCWDYPLDMAQYRIYRGFEVNDRGFHL